MSDNQDNNLGALVERLLKRGERVVIVGQGEPMVILPLAEYEKLSDQPGNTENIKESAYLEPVDNLGGSVEDDDQYYPEPI